MPTFGAPVSNFAPMRVTGCGYCVSSLLHETIKCDVRDQLWAPTLRVWILTRRVKNHKNFQLPKFGEWLIKKLNHLPTCATRSTYCNYKLIQKFPVNIQQNIAREGTLLIEGNGKKPYNSKVLCCTFLFAIVGVRNLAKYKTSRRNQKMVYVCRPIQLTNRSIAIMQFMQFSQWE